MDNLPHESFTIRSMVTNDNVQGQMHESDGDNSDYFFVHLNVIVPEIFSGLPGDTIMQLFLAQLYREMTDERAKSRPASKNAIATCQTNDIKACDVEKKIQCSVCQDYFNIGEKALSLPCEHLYHIDCIMPWFKEHNTCPTCRHELATEDT